MSRAVLLGVPDTRRTTYFMQAAAQAGLPLLFLDWNDWQDRAGDLAEGGVWMKIDPPFWDSCALGELDDLAGAYKRRLGRLAKAGENRAIRFLNHPSAIAELLDKVKCKETLRRAGLPVTEPVAGTFRGGSTAEMAGRFCLNASDGSGSGSFSGVSPVDYAIVRNAEQLLQIMRDRGISQVFIKPVNGSGAAGVSAFRLQRGSGRMALYTCAVRRQDGDLVNTKRLRRFSEPAEVLSLLDSLLLTECIIERWYAKAGYQGYSYDLRAVVQGGRVDVLLARLSKGPVTNLHLNNRPLDSGALSLPAAVLDEIADICQRAMALYPGLFSAGIDILLEKGSLKPRIIEMNGQGDLIYQDIFHDNIIYRRQAEFLKRMGEQA